MIKKEREFRQLFEDRSAYYSTSSDLIKAIDEDQFIKILKDKDIIESGYLLIKIKKSNMPTYWYADFIGQVFIVKKNLINKQYEVVAEHGEDFFGCYFDFSDIDIVGHIDNVDDIFIKLHKE